MLSVFFACIGALVATTILVCVVASVAIGCLQPYDLFDEEIRSRLRATPSPTTLLESLHRFIRLLQTKALIGAISLPVKAAEERLTPAGTRMLIKTVLTLTASKSSPGTAPAPASTSSTVSPLGPALAFQDFIQKTLIARAEAEGREELSLQNFVEDVSKTMTPMSFIQAGAHAKEILTALPGGQDIWASLTTKQPSTEDHTAQREKLWASMFSAAPRAMPTSTSTSTSTSSTDTDAKPTTRRIRRPVVQ
jgi:hypothetical protein